jgi:hypothetical protein
MPKQRGLLESPLTPALSPLAQGGRGYGSGGILPAKSPFGAPNKGGWCIPLSKTTQGEAIFRTPPLDKALPFWGILKGVIDAGWSSLVARRAHNPKVVGSNPTPATIFLFNLHLLAALLELVVESGG